MGSFWLIGANDHGQCDVPPAIPLIDGDCGGVITLTLLENGQMMTFGLDADGLVSDTPIDGDFEKISAGGYNNAAIMDSGAENQPPVADPGGPYKGTVGEFMFLDGSKSKDSDGTIDSYHWVLGDGQIYTDSLPQVLHVYAVEGKYKVTLTVTDDDGATGEASTEVVISGNNTIRPFVWFDPEKLNLGRDGGNVKATIFGSEDLDVRKVDPDSISLEGVLANLLYIEDFGGPFDPPDTPIPDGFDDLKSRFPFSDLKQTEKFEGLSDGDIVVLRLSGNLFDEYGGNPIEGQDEVVIKIKNEDLIVEDFESYSIEMPIKETWTDGVGSPGNPGNGTGSTLELESWRAHQFASFSYNNYDWPYCSEISKIFDPSQNWEKYGTYIEVEVIGINGSTSSVSYDPEEETYTVIGSGDDIWGTSDEFYYVYKKLDGDGSITAGIPTYGSCNSWSKAGIMIRDTLDEDSAHATFAITPNDNVNFISRVNEGDSSQSIKVKIDKTTAMSFFRLNREDNLFWIEYTDNLSSNNWLPVKSPKGDVIGPFSIPMNKEVYIGMIVTSGNENATIEVEFADVSTTGEVSPDGPFVTSEDVGIPHNDPAPFCLKVEDIHGHSAVANHPDDPTAIQIKDWNSWSIPLTVFSEQGVDLTEINKIIFGIGDLDILEPGGLGMVYIDNIIVYSP
jgi:regulation of enolase protein 1 (concanavalin A-like superfamily)